MATTKGTKIIVNGNDLTTLLLFRGHLLRELSKDHQLIITCPTDDLCSQLPNDIDAKFIAINMQKRGKNPLRDLFLIFKYWRIFNKERPCLILNFTIKPNIYAGIAARWLKYHYISVVPGLGRNFQKYTLLSALIVRLYRYSQKKAKHILFLNQSDKRFFASQRIGDEACYLQIPGEGVNLDFYQYQPIPEGPRTFLFLGRLLKSKGIELYLQAAEKLKKQYPETIFNIVGSSEIGSSESLSEDYLTSLPYVNFHSYQTDIRQDIATCHCLVLPSMYKEGMPRVLLEAGAIGRPAIASDIAGCNDVIEDSVNGLLCRAGDLDSLLQCMQKIINTPLSQLGIWGQAAHEKIENHFSDQLVFERYNQIISAICN